MSFAKYAFCMILLIGLAGCSRTSQENAAQQPPSEAQQAVTQPQPPPQAAPEATPAPEPPKNVAATARAKPAKPPKETTRAVKSTPTPEPVEPAAESPSAVREKAPEPVPPEVVPPKPKFATIAEGTKISVRLQDALDSSVNQSGDTFRTILDKDIVVDGQVVAPRGCILEGKLSNVKRSGRVEGRASMTLQLTSLAVGEQTYALQTDILSFEAESTKKKDATKVGIGAGIGAVIGAIAGGGKGAAIGAAVGGGAGGATVLATRGDEVKFEPEAAFSFALQNSVSVRLQ